MSRTPMIAGNWKLNLSVAEGVALVAAIKDAADAANAEVVVCPTALGLSAAVDAAAGSKVRWVRKTPIGKNQALLLARFLP